MRGRAAGGDSLAYADSGVRPIRLRGYFRALKRGEPWAVKLSKKWGTLSFWLEWTYSPEFLKAMVYAENPFLSMISKDVGWTGSYMTVPMTIGCELKQKKKREQ